MCDTVSGVNAYRVIGQSIYCPSLHLLGLLVDLVVPEVLTLLGVPGYWKLESTYPETKSMKLF